MSVLRSPRQPATPAGSAFRRWVARVAVIATGAAGTTVAFTGAAFAAAPSVTGTVDCDGTAHVTVTGDEASQAIDVGYAVNSTTVTDFTAAQGALVAPAYSFTTSFRTSPSLKPGDVVTFAAKDGSTGQGTPAPLPTYTIPASCGSTSNGNGGSNGTVKINGQYGVDDINDSNIANQPHVQCPFTLKFYDFDPGTNTADVTFTSQAPSSPATGDQLVPANTGRTHFTFTGAGEGGTLNHTELYRLDTTGLIEQPEQGFHIKVTTVVTSAHGQVTFSKSKVYWIAPCPGNPDVNIDKSGPATGTLHQTGTYTLTVANAAGADVVTDDPITVTDTLPAGEDFVSASGDGWTQSVDGQVITFTHANPDGLAGGASLPVITVVVRYTATGELTDTAVVEQVTDETHTSDNTDSVTTTVTPPVQTLAAAIYDCSTGTASATPVSGGHIDATGPQTLSSDNPLTATEVAAGDYTVTATAPTGYHFVTTCGDATATNPQSVSVPEGGSGSASFYVVHDTGSIVGVIVDCSTGTAGSPVSGGSWSATGPQDASGANGVAQDDVLTGTYSMTATAPADYHFVTTCGDSSGPNPQDVTVPENGTGTGTFYVAHDTGNIIGVIVDCSTGIAVTGGSWSATGPQDASGANGVAQNDVLTGTYTMTATPPASYHLVSCDHGDADSKTVVVPANDTGQGTFYVAHDTGSIVGVILDCTTGTAGDALAGGSWDASGPQSVSGANGETQTDVLTGTYSMSATAPDGYHIVTTCGDATGDNPQDVTVPVNGTGTGTFYAAHDTGDIVGVILDCSTGTAGSQVTGGSWSATGPQEASGANGVAQTGVLTGTYSMTATAPADYHFVTTCGDATGDNPQDVTVPVNGTGTGTFYVAHDTGSIVGVILDCSTGTAGDAVPGGSWDASGPQTASGANGVAQTGVLTGTYSMTATAPDGYHLVTTCGDATGDNPQDVTVPVNGTGTGTFYVAHDTGDIVGAILDCTTGTAGSAVTGGSWSATGPQDASGANGVAQTGVLTGTYSMSAAAPTGYTLVTTCGEASGPNPQDVTVPVNGTGTGTFYATKNPDVAIDKSGPATGTQNLTGDYTLTVSAAAGTTDIAGPITVTDVLPDGESFVSASGTDWTSSYDADTSTITLTHEGGLASGATLPVITVTVTYTAQGELTDIATVIAPENDTNPDNNTDTVTTTVGPPPAITLGVDKLNDANHDGDFSDSETAQTLGETVTYQVTVTNTSSVPVVITGVTDAAPVDSEAGPVACLVDDATVVGTVLAPTQTVTCTFTGTAPTTADTSLTDLVTVLGTQVGFPDNGGQGQDTSTVVTAPPAPPGTPDLAIIKAADKPKVKVGDTLTYTLAVTNVGSADTDATSTVTDTVPAALSITSVTADDTWSCATSGQTVTCTHEGVIAAGASASPITIATLVGSAAVGTLTNTGTVSNPGDHNPGNDTSTVKTPVTTVQGEKVVKTPRTPGSPSVLPFTGSDTGSMLLLALELMVAGAALSLLARRRRRTTG